MYISPNVGQKPEELILQAFHKWEKVAVEKHKKEKAERDEVSDRKSPRENIRHIFRRLIVFDGINYVENAKKKNSNKRVKMNHHELLKLPMKKRKKLRKKMHKRR